MQTTDRRADGNGHSAPARASVQSSKTRLDFFNEVVSVLRATLPEAYRDFRHRSNPLLLKVDFGNPRVHYEIWCDSEKRILGAGLHFEDGPASTEAYLSYFDRHIVEIKHLLGTAVELERWTASWGHLYEHRDLGPLTNEVAHEIGTRMAEMIAILQPLVVSAAIPPERSAEAESGERRGPWRKWRR